MPTLSPAALALRRRRLLALHRSHAGRVRALFYWFGAELAAIDGAVLRCFVLAERHGLLPSDARAGPWLGHLAWRVATTSSASASSTSWTALTTASASPAALATAPAVDALARFLAAHAPEAAPRAAFILAEFAGLGPTELATLLETEPLALRAALRRLRRTLAEDPEVRALGGPRSLLAACLAPFLADTAWTRRHAALLLAHTRAPPPASLLLRPRGIIGLGLAALALLLLLRPAPTSPPAPAPPAPPLALAPPAPPPVLEAPPAPVPAPTDMSQEPPQKPRRTRAPRKRDAPAEALARREQLASARDPGAIIVELELLGAGRKALAASPGQALAYAEQHGRDYPDSQLIGHRAELRVRALCALGRRDEARAEAERRGPGKARDALKEACGL